MHSYASFKADNLPQSVGVNLKQGSRRSEGVAGYLSYGPYIDISAGTYCAGFYIRCLDESSDGTITVDVCSNAGQSEVARKDIPVRELADDVVQFVKVDFHLHMDATRLEARLHVSEGVMIELSELVIFRR